MTKKMNQDSTNAIELTADNGTVVATSFVDTFKDASITNTVLQEVDANIKALVAVQSSVGLTLTKEYAFVAGNKYFKDLGYNSLTDCFTKRYGISKQLVSDMKAISENFMECDIDEKTHVKHYSFIEKEGFEPYKLGYGKLRTIAHKAKDSAQAMEWALDSEFNSLSVRKLEDKIKETLNPESSDTDTDTNSTESVDVNENVNVKRKKAEMPEVVEIAATTKEEFLKKIQDYIKDNDNWKGLAFKAI